MDVNDNAHVLVKRVVLEFIASKLTHTKATPGPRDAKARFKAGFRR
jgi:carbamoylphosphate synthase small subunit